MKLISQAVKKFLDMNEVPNGLWSQVGDEGHFSWLPCGICESNLGGDRFEMEFVTHALEEGKFTDSVCHDCFIYLETGDDAPIQMNYHANSNGAHVAYAKALDKMMDKILGRKNES